MNKLILKQKYAVVDSKENIIEKCRYFQTAKEMKRMMQEYYYEELKIIEL